MAEYISEAVSRFVAVYNCAIAPMLSRKQLTKRNTILNGRVKNVLISKKLLNTEERIQPAGNAFPVNGFKHRRIKMHAFALVDNEFVNFIICDTDLQDIC